MVTTFRSVPPPSYVSPEKRDMAQAAGAYDTRAMPVSLVADLAHIAAGGELLPPSHYRAQVRQEADARLPSPNEKGMWTLGDQIIANRDEAVRAYTTQAMVYHQGVQDFVGSLKLSEFPGDTPLQQALSAVGLLSKIKGGAVGEDGNVPLFSGHTHPEGVAKSLHEALLLADSVGQLECDMLYPAKRELTRLEIAKDLVPNSKLRVMLEISRKLDSLSALKAQRERKTLASPYGDEFRLRAITDFDEIARLPADGWALYGPTPAYWRHLAATGQLTIRERITEENRKQAIFILVDGSGSMAGEKHFKASGVVMNRLKAVVQGDAVVYIGVYDNTLHGIYYAETPAQARDLMKYFAGQNFSGGGTDTGGAIKAAHEYLRDKMAKRNLWKPDIVVLTDGDSSVGNIRPSDIPGTRVHGFAMSVDNPELAEIARLTGGVCLENL